MSGPQSKVEVELTPARFSEEAAASYVLGAVPKGVEVSGPAFMEQLLKEFPRHSASLMAKKALSVVLRLETSDGFFVKGDRESIYSVTFGRKST